MNLTERLLEFRVRRVWRRSIAPAAEALRERDVDVLEPPADDAESWYTPMHTSTHFVDVADVERALADLWQQQGLPELASCSGDVAKLVKALRRSSTSQREVSSDVYAMY